MPAESRASNRFYSKYLSTGYQSYPQARGYPQKLSTGWGWGGVVFPRRRTEPPCVKRGLCLYYTPQKKIYAKVKCPNLYTYF